MFWSWERRRALASHQPKLLMKPGDLCEVEIEGLGTLSNSVIAEI
jgi:2-keto-4-pentenoate hydratase/2-oxohepta-3-ene-1,7-dioic acid hydratase in catechol pathway